jgi:uncharacterized membrane protein
METPIRSLAKAITWRVLALVVTVCVALAITSDFQFAAAIGAADTAIKIGVYYAHERSWERVSFGRKKEPEYYI